jgi:ABC-type Zn uptake system ZnuABC Zn-binding protein ZnuA
VPPGGSATRPANERLRIVCTFLPVYVFTLNVTRDVPGVRAELLVSSDVGCPHDYSLRPEDVRRLADADLIVVNGLGLEPFLGAEPSQTEDPRHISISDQCDVIRSEHEEAEDPHGGHAHSHGNESEVNPHVWVSPAQAIKQVQTLADKLGRRDARYAQHYSRNAAVYVERLSALRDRFAAAGKTFEKRNIVTFHDAFAYLARDLKLKVVATLTQDPEHAPSAREIADAVETIKRTQAAAIFYEPAYPVAVARTVSQETGVPLFPLNPFNSMATPPTVDSYEAVMDQNLRTLQQVLGGAL